MPLTDSFDDPAQGEPAEDLEQVADAPATPPLVAFARRHRFVIGLGVAVVMVGLMILALVALKPPTPAPGIYGIVQQYAFPLMCCLIAVVGLTWGLRVERKWTNLAAFGAIATYFIYLIAGWAYEQFVL